MMKKFSKKFAAMIGILTLLLYLAPFSTGIIQAANTVYYVDSVDGNDSNAGTSESTAWKTLTKVNSMTFGAGDQILFKAGCSWSGALLPKGSGSSGSPIKIDMYGTGAQPIIDGAGAGATIKLSNQQYWEIGHIDIQNNAALGTDRVGLYLYAKDAGTLNHIYVNYVNFSNIVSRAPNYTPGSNESAGSFTGGIVGYIAGTTTPTRFNDVKIENCTFRNTDRNVFYFFYSPWYNNSTVGMSGGAGAMFNSTNVVFRNNYALDIPGTGMCLCACDGAILEYNVMDNCQYNVNSNIAGVAASTWASNDCIYQYNEIMNTHGTADGQAMDNDGGCQRCIFQYNYSHDNNGGFYLSCSGSTCKVYDGIFRYNISQNDLNGIFDHRSSSYRTLIYNNTIYTRPGITVPMFRTDTDSKYGTATISNNIFYNMGGTISVASNPFTWSYNVFYGNYSSTPSDANKLTSNPELVNPGSGGNGRNTVDGYMLQANSPCINSGVSISNNGGKDYWGNTLYNGSPDRGAHEFQGTPVTSTPGPTPTQGPTPTATRAATPTPTRRGATPTPTRTFTVTQVTLTSYFNADGFSYDTGRNSGNYDTSGYTFSADLTNAAPTFENVGYQMGPFANGSNNVINCSGQTISFTGDTYISLRLLGSATAGNKTGTFRINYSDGTYSNVSVTMGDWCTGNAGQKIIQSMTHRHSQTADSGQTVYIFAYYLTPTSGKTVNSIVLPSNTGMHVLALSLLK